LRRTDSFYKRVKRRNNGESLLNLVMGKALGGGEGPPQNKERVPTKTSRKVKQRGRGHM